MKNTHSPSVDDLRWMYENMVISRRLEDRLTTSYLEGKVPTFDMTAGPLPGEMHLSKGQEPCAVGVCAHLKTSDYVTSTHRPHHVAVAKGVDLEAMTAEIFGRKSGLSAGKGGHMHLFAPEVNFCCSGIVGQGIGIALGHALAAKIQGTDAVAVAFTGEGAANQGIFHESMNMAGLWKLPFICVIEDNRWGVSVSKARSTAIERNSDRASAYAAVGEYVEDNDVWGIYEAAGRAVQRARAGEGPTIIEIETVRLAGHFLPDPESYIAKTELAGRRDPIDVMRARLAEDGLVDDKELDRLEAGAESKVAEAFDKALAADYPSAEEALDSVFA